MIAAMVLPRWFSIAAIVLTVLFFGMPAISAMVTSIVLYFEQPLENPVQVVAVNAGGLKLEDGAHCELAGVHLPEDPEDLARALEFLTIATRKGVEIERRVDGDASLVRCALFRTNTFCGNAGPGNYTCESLNQIVLSFGFARFDTAAHGLDEDERLMLQACERRAIREQWGVWAPPCEVREPRQVGRGYDSRHFNRLTVWEWDV